MWNSMVKSKDNNNNNSKKQKYQKKIEEYQQKIDEIDRNQNIHQMQSIRNTTSGSNYPLSQYEGHTFPISRFQLPQMSMGSFFDFTNPLINMNNIPNNETHFKMQSYSNVNGDETYNYMEKNNGATIKQESWKRDKNGNVTRNFENPSNVRTIE